MHAGPPGRLTDCLGIVAVVLAALDVGFDVLRRDETHLVTERGQLARPMVSAGTSLHGDLGGRQLLEESNYLRAAEIDPQHRSVFLGIM
jgi:hypothetical protein